MVSGMDKRLRFMTDLIAPLKVAPGSEAMLLNRAQSLGYELVRPHRVVLVEAHGSDDKIDMFFHAVGRAAKAIRVGSLLAPRLHDVTLLADTEAPWDRFWARVVTELNGGCCRIGVGGRCFEPNGFPNSCREAELALRMQKTVGGPSGSRSPMISGSTGSWPRRATHPPWSASWPSGSAR